ncbi:MAG TPA: chemoreceptor glutamine deamidase CheD [Usitatibacter sp.]|nr:chemoreceptor glutamine deamidase CheD [Usitatibacter sp.]
MTAIDATIPSDAIRVLPGEYFATNKDVAIVTVLGSCVAACLHDAAQGIGGMNHFMLPREGNEAGPASTSARYGVHAMEMLINRLVRLGARRAGLVAKVFGGGNVLAGITALNVGQANAEFVTEFLRAESIPVTASDLQGTQSRKVCFFPATGRVLVRSIQNGQQRAIAERESQYGAGLVALPRGGDVEFFR